MSVGRSVDERWRAGRPAPVHTAPRLSPISRMCMFATIALVVLGLFMQIGRIAFLSGQGKAIAALRSQIQELTVEGQYLTIELSSRQSIDRVRDEAGRLGMVYPKTDQVRVVSRSALQYAAAQNGDQVDVAQGDAQG
ncbi:MAG: hypothetical protein GX558_07225 [Clostridiales bacterium]|nr:hypothetical protein [Clostridiales bacterium]